MNRRLWQRSLRAGLLPAQVPFTVTRLPSISLRHSVRHETVKYSTVKSAGSPTSVSSEGASAVTASTKEELEALVVKLKEENKKLSDHVYRLQSELLDVRTKENSQGRIASMPRRTFFLYAIAIAVVAQIVIMLAAAELSKEVPDEEDATD